MCIKQVIDFCEFDWFYDKYKPLTPYGLDAKMQYSLINDVTVLNEIHTNTDLALSFIKNDNNKVLKIEHFLSRIDRLNNLDKEQFDAADLFLIKKLLINYKALSALLPDEWISSFKAAFKSKKLLSELAPDNTESESFHLSSSFSYELLQIRNRIGLTDKLLREIRQKTLREIKERFNLDFDGREFILIEKSLSDKLDTPHLLIELYDVNYLKVKPVFPKAFTDAQMEKETLLQQESHAETHILKQLSTKIAQEKENLKLYIEAIKQIDIYIAKARISNMFGLVKPQIADNPGLHVREGRFLALEERQNKSGTKYTPLSATFKTNTTLLSGSNMGGKTILFKTIGFLQVLTQLGFRVPAKQFISRLYDSIHILSTYENNEVEGLSSFGQEVFGLSSALVTENKATLILADELAKTTNATEAKAILYGILKWLAAHSNYTGFLSTHFINMPVIAGVGKYRMKGLNRKEFEKHYLRNQEESINERIKLINSFMQYEVELDNNTDNKQDALSIARLLGLNEDIIKNANEYLGKTI